MGNTLLLTTTYHSIPLLKHLLTWAIDEDFDAVINASGHYTVPYVPHTQGLAEFAAAYPGSVLHSKAYRGRDKYAGKVSITSLCIYYL